MVEDGHWWNWYDPDRPQMIFNPNPRVIGGYVDGVRSATFSDPRRVGGYVGGASSGTFRSPFFEPYAYGQDQYRAADGTLLEDLLGRQAGMDYGAGVSAMSRAEMDMYERRHPFQEYLNQRILEERAKTKETKRRAAAIFQKMFANEITGGGAYGVSGETSDRDKPDPRSSFARMREIKRKQAAGRPRPRLGRY